MTINQMNNAELAERMGTDATDEMAEQFRDALIANGFGDTESAEIPDGTWLEIMQKTL